MRSPSDHNKQQPVSSGFTLVEMLVVVPIVLIVIGVLVSAMVTMIGDALSTNAYTLAAYNTRSALDRIEEDARISVNFASQTTPTPSPQGKDNGTAPFTSAQGDLILSQQATSTSPYNKVRDLIYFQQPGTCSGDISANGTLFMQVVYYTTTTSGKKTLWRRVLVRDWNKNATPDEKTVCATPWQRDTCAVGCTAKDEKLLEDVSEFTTTYYTSTGGTTTDPSKANTIMIKLSTTGKAAGRPVTQTGTVQVTRINDMPTPAGT